MLENARVGHLGLLDTEDHPRVLPVTFAVHDGAIWSAVDDKPKRSPKPARIQFLERAPTTAFTIDHYSDEWSELAWVQVLGEMRIVQVADGATAITALARKYDPYRETPPRGPLLELTPSRCLWWRASEKDSAQAAVESGQGPGQRSTASGGSTQV